MTTLDFYSFYALLVSNALLLGAAALVILKFQRKEKAAAQFWDSPTGSALQAQGEQDLINSETAERLAALQLAIERIEKANTSPAPPTEKLPFDNAVRMAQAGASLDDLVRTCGLSHGEARLFMRVHARAAA